MRANLLVALFAAILTGCASVGSHQAKCEAQTTTFPNMVRCLKAAVGDSQHADKKLYLLTAEQLSQKVQNGEMSDLDARVALQDLYTRLQNEESDNAPRSTRCRQVQGVTYCRHY